MTFAAEGKWTGGSGAAVLEERAAAVEVHLSVEAEVPEAGGGHLEGTCRHEELHIAGNKEHLYAKMGFDKGKTLQSSFMQKDKGKPLLQA